MIGNAAEHVAQISARFDVVQFAGRNERIHCRRAITPAVRHSEEEIAATEGDTAQRIFSYVVVYFHGPIAAIQLQRVPLIQGVVDCLGRFRFARQGLELCSKPGSWMSIKGCAFSWRTRKRSSGGLPRMPASMA